MHKHEPDLFWRLVVLTYFVAIGTFFTFLALRGAVRNLRRDLQRWREARTVPTR